MAPGAAARDVPAARDVKPRTEGPVLVGSPTKCEDVWGLAEEGVFFLAQLLGILACSFFVLRLEV